MLLFSSRFRASRVPTSRLPAPRLTVRRVAAWPLGALLFAAVAPVRAQSAAPQTASSPGASASTVPVPTAPAPNESGAPKLTTESRPASSISTARRPFAARPIRGRSLVMAEPDARSAPAKKVSIGNAAPRPLAAPQRVMPQRVAQPSSTAPKAAILTNVLAPTAPNAGVISGGVLTPQTLISPAKPVKVTSKTRFGASRVSAQNGSLDPSNANATASNDSTPKGAPANGAAVNGVMVNGATPKTTPLDAGVSKTPFRAASNGAPLIALAPPQSATTPTPTPPMPSPTVAGLSPRDQMARLPSRGGLMQNRAPIKLQPEAPVLAPQSRAITEEQRRLLAELDADLGRAQQRLDRAETRLTQGQQQLGAFTGVLRSAMLDAGEDARGLHPFVRVAQRYMGTPYVWGGESARGFDCSGFIMRVMRDLGYSALPHSAAEQFHYGLPVAKGLLKPGDIVFFANTYKPGVSHVGIYLGRGRFIHAANSKVGTIVSNLNESKWVEHYAGARRLLAVKS